MTGLCSTFFIIGAALAPFLIYRLYRQARLSGSLVVHEEYELTPDGHLRAEHAVFDPAAKILTVHESSGDKIIPFAGIRGIQLQVGTSRKIHIGLLLKDDTLPLSVVTNHDLKLAGINAHRVAEIVAGDGEGFLKAFREFRWQRNLIGSTFAYLFGEMRR